MKKKEKTKTSTAPEDSSGFNQRMRNKLYLQMKERSTPSTSADVNDGMVSSLSSDFAQMQVESEPFPSTLEDTTAITDPTTLEHKSSNKRVQKSRISKTFTIGQEKAFGEVCDFLTRSDVGMVGIYGMAGVGKTKLMDNVCNEFLIPDFKVIRIVVSRTVNVGTIQRSIMRALKLSFHEEQDPQARGMEINGALFKGDDKVALLLDDIWEYLSLEELGVAAGRGLDTSKFKIIFTTRLENVCLQMEPDQKMKIECLGPEDSWALFKQSVGDKTLNSHYRILGLAKEVAKECAGLPLALTIIGKAMVCKTSPQAWEDALKSLRNCPSMISGAETNLFERLKFSYDNLENQVERECFLFCCMYPEDQKIDIDTLVGAWIGEGLLDIGYGTYQEAWNRGHGISDTLVAKSLLETNKSKFLFLMTVKMHDVIRDMGIWIGSESNYFVHTDNLKINREEIAKRWNGARHVYVGVYNDVLPKELDCPNLSSLHIYPMGGAINVSNTFLNSMKFMCKLKVLIIHNVEFECPEIPTSTFGLLAELRHLEIKTSNMRALPPDIGNLTKLLALILFDNDILTTLPPTIGGLCELRKLQISNYSAYLMNIPLELGKLKKLEIVHIYTCGELKMDNILNQCAELRKLRLVVRSPTMLSNDLLYNLKKLEELHIQFGLLNRMEMDKLWNEGLRGLTSLKVLTMDGWLIANGDEVIYAIGAMRQLRELRIIRCNNIDKLVIPAAHDNFLHQLEVLEINMCRRLEKVHFRKRALQSLCFLEIGYCNALAHVVGLQHLLQLRELKIDNLGKFEEGLITTDVDEHCSPSDVQTYPVCFPNLQCLRLDYLSSMKRICDDSVSFPSLSVFRLFKCPKLETIYAIGAMRQLRELRIIACDIDKLVIPAAPDNFLPQLEVLEIRGCYLLEKVHFRKRALQSLCILKIGDCDSLAHVVGLQHLQQLREVEIVGLQEIKERLITTDVDEHCSPSDVQTYPVCFPNLQCLHLVLLESMKLICDDSVSFPSLSKFTLEHCPHLEKLPRGLMNENRMTPMISGEIRGTEEWWEGLEWEDDAFKSYLRPLLVVDRDFPLYPSEDEEDSLSESEDDEDEAPSV